MHNQRNEGSTDPENSALTPKTRVLTREQKRLCLAIALSIVVHVVVVFVAPFLFPTTSPHDKAGLRVWLTPKKEVPKQTTTESKKIVVSLEESPAKEKPKTANYLADHDHVAKKEQRARPSAPQHQAAKQTEQMDKPKADSRGNRNRARQQVTENFPGPNTTGAQKPNEDKKDNKDPLGIRPAAFGFDGNNALAHNDHVPNVADGEKTDLNAWQWRHAPFFNRMKARIGQVWSPHSQISRYDPNGALLGHKDRVTVMSVTINRDGELTNLTITNPSGVAYLDDEAVRAFRVAAPFLYPPKELFNDENEFSFSFAFHLQINRGISFDFEWKND